MPSSRRDVSLEEVSLSYGRAALAMRGCCRLASEGAAPAALNHFPGRSTSGDRGITPERARRRLTGDLLHYCWRRNQAKYLTDADNLSVFGLQRDGVVAGKVQNRAPGRDRSTGIIPNRKPEPMEMARTKARAEELRETSAILGMLAAAQLMRILRPKAASPSRTVDGGSNAGATADLAIVQSYSPDGSVHGGSR